MTRRPIVAHNWHSLLLHSNAGAYGLQLTESSDIRQYTCRLFYQITEMLYRFASQYRTYLHIVHSPRKKKIEYSLLAIRWNFTYEQVGLVEN